MTETDRDLLFTCERADLCACAGTGEYPDERGEFSVCGHHFPVPEVADMQWRPGPCDDTADPVDSSGPGRRA